MEEIFEKTFLASRYDLRPHLKKITVPTLIIHGDYDPIPIWTAKEIRNTLPNSTLVILKECGHFPYIEQPKRFFREVNQFMEKVKNESPDQLK